VSGIAAGTSKPWLAKLGLSLGYAATAEGIPVDRLVSVADSRLYEDKRRNR
jgi:hypothetical protein